MNFSLGLIEIQALGHAIFVLDEMLKAANVQFVATERKLGGRLVTLVVKGEVSAVSASIEAGKQIAQQFGCLKACEVIARPHPEILKFLHIDENGEIIPVEKTALTNAVAVNETVVKKAEVKKEEKPQVAKKTAKTQSKKTTPSKSIKKEEITPDKKVSKVVKTTEDKKAPLKKGKKTSKKA